MKNHRTGLLLVFLWALTTPVQAQVTPGSSSRAPDAKVKPATEDPNYVIGPDDVLKIEVFKETDVSGSVPVRPDGKISVPLLHDVQAAGLTPNELAQSISSKLKEYMAQPEVTVVVTQINRRPVYVMGEVGRQGPVAFSSGMTVLQVLASAGGLTEFANRKGIYILRNEHGKQTRYPFNYKKAIRGQADPQSLELKPGDTIFVP